VGAGGLTPLRLAIARRDADALRLLLAYGTGETDLDRALEDLMATPCTDMKMVHLLAEAGGLAPLWCWATRMEALDGG
jgi:hypothetical protein